MQVPVKLLFNYRLQISKVTQKCILNLYYSFVIARHRSLSFQRQIAVAVFVVFLSLHLMEIKDNVQHISICYFRDRPSSG